MRNYEEMGAQRRPLIWSLGIREGFLEEGTLAETDGSLGVDQAKAECVV